MTGELFSAASVSKSLAASHEPTSVSASPSATSAALRSPVTTGGLKVAPLCLGTMMFGGPTDEATSSRIVARAREAGINEMTCGGALRLLEDAELRFLRRWARGITLKEALGSILIPLSVSFDEPDPLAALRAE